LALHSFILLAGLFFNLSPPISWTAAAIFSCSFILALLLSAVLTVLLIISLFWTISGEGLLCLAPHVSLFLSGLIVPLPLFPAWAQPFLNLQPLRGLVDIPSRIYTGIIPVNQAFYYLGFQLVWIVLLIFIGKKLMQKALNNFVIQGG
jgi:ABC-2 type transport system permease protein